MQAATHDFVGATLYAEAGARLFAIRGFGRTNLRPYWNLGFDPNVYLQFGAATAAPRSVVSVYAIHDDRLDGADEDALTVGGICLLSGV